jgi:hypothetical protein
LATFEEDLSSSIAYSSLMLSPDLLSDFVKLARGAFVFFLEAQARHRFLPFVSTFSQRIDNIARREGTIV